MKPTHRIIVGDVRAVLGSLPERSVQLCMTSPPYWALRSYLPADHAAKALEMGSEPTPEAYSAGQVEVFRAVRRVLRDDGTLWLNLGDSFSAERWSNKPSTSGVGRSCQDVVATKRSGLPDKNLVGIPWRAAMALQADGWYLRSEVVWSKPNPMPESVADRPTKAHEQVFLLTKAPRYFYDADAVREPLVKGAAGSRFDKGKTGVNGMGRVQEGERADNPAGRNLRSVWTIATRPSRVSHFAVMAPALAERCIKAGTSERGCCAACGAPWARVVERTAMVIKRSGRGDSMGAFGQTQSSGTMVRPASSVTTGRRPTCPCTAPTAPCRVLDPFGGSGTTASVAVVLGRVGTICEPNETYRSIVGARYAEVQRAMDK